MTVTEIVADLAANPRPVLYLDTCVFLDILRAGWREPVEGLKAAQRLITSQSLPVPRSASVVAYLTTTEFEQNWRGVSDEAEREINRVDRMFEVADVLGWPVSTPKFSESPTLAQDLYHVATVVLSISLRIDRDPGCTEKAVDRVLEKRKPSANGNVKDSIQLEHALALARAVQAAGLPCRVAFVSSNKADFGTSKADSRLDPGLKATDFDPAGLEFFSRLDAALGAVGL